MSFFTHAPPKLRQEGFAPSTSPGPSSPSSAFDPANLYFAHHIFPNQPSTTNPSSNNSNNHPNHSNHVLQDPPRVDFGDDLAAMLAHHPRPPSPPHHPPHNPFDTNSTAPYRPAPAPTNNTHPHNIFDVSAPNPFPAHFSLPEHTTTHPYASPFDYPDHHNNHSNQRSRSRSRSKPPAIPRGRIPGPPTTKKRPSMSSSPGRPHAIHIPPPGSPLALHIQQHQHYQQQQQQQHQATSAWFGTADSPFSLPTPDSVGVSHFGGSPSAKDSPPPPAQDKQAQLASEKRRRRRESHNAVERRRRDNINEKISELATLIPECMLDPSVGGAAAGAEASLDGFAGVPHAQGSGADDLSLADERKDSGAVGTGAVKANKGMILRKSVEYIRYLQQLVNAQATRNRELEARLAAQSVGGVVGGGVGAGGVVGGAVSGTALVSHQEDDGMGGLVLDEAALSLGSEEEDGAAMGIGMGMGIGSESPPQAESERGRQRGRVRVKREDDQDEGEEEGEGEEEDGSDEDGKRMEE